MSTLSGEPYRTSRTMCCARVKSYASSSTCVVVSIRQCKRDAMLGSSYCQQHDEKKRQLKAAIKAAKEGL